MPSPVQHPSNLSLSSETKEIQNLLSYISKNPNQTSQLNEYIVDALKDVKEKMNSLENHIQERSQQLDNSMLHVKKNTESWQRSRENVGHLLNEVEYQNVRQIRSDRIKERWTQSRVTQRDTLLDMCDSNEKRIQLERELHKDMENRKKWDLTSLVEIGLRGSKVFTEPLDPEGNVGLGRDVSVGGHGEEDITELSNLSMDDGE
mmetsp:Transcript_415/g.1576  ORF Transcript_415/g.1576 Transcript_415/m.1576 type:complete len:204 (-) Transcript_415:95-706(-)